jgi:murein DD-endopeptidase MepM/ murein hydrolase activator NlpD
MALRVFPVDASGHPSFADAFGSHRGTDIFAPAGTPVLAVDAGNIRAAIDPKGGTVAYLASSDGTRYYYAHLQEYVGTYPRAVAAGDVIGLVGTSGNAQGKAPHLHFEAHPNGEARSIDPFPDLMAVAPANSLKLPVPVLPMPPNPLKKKSRRPEPWGRWSCCWGRLLSRATSGCVVGAELLSGDQ